MPDNRIRYFATIDGKRREMSREEFMAWHERRRAEEVKKEAAKNERDTGQRSAYPQPG